MTSVFSRIRHICLALCALLVMPVAAEAAVFAKYDGVDGEAQDRSGTMEITAHTTVGDLMNFIARQSGQDRAGIIVQLDGVRLSADQRLNTVGGRARCTPSARSGPEHEPNGFCYQKIIWLVQPGQARRGTVRPYDLMQVEQDMAPTRRRR
jgi:hypothetical protein